MIIFCWASFLYAENFAHEEDSKYCTFPICSLKWYSPFCLASTPPQRFGVETGWWEQSDSLTCFKQPEKGWQPTNLVGCAYIPPSLLMLFRNRMQNTVVHHPSLWMVQDSRGSRHWPRVQNEEWLYDTLFIYTHIQHPVEGLPSPIATSLDSNRKSSFTNCSACRLLVSSSRNSLLWPLSS